MPWVRALDIGFGENEGPTQKRDSVISLSVVVMNYPDNSQPSGGVGEVEVSDVYLKPYVARILLLVKPLQQEAQLAQASPLDFAACNIQPGD